MAEERTQRRLAAILAADVVGYSRLMEQDEAGTLAAIRDLRREVIDPLLSQHHGRIVKLMGDGALVEFGSVVDAVACAVAIQKDVAARQPHVPLERRIMFRIGINLGDVVVEGDDLLGDGVNVAARLDGLAAPGGICISGKIHDEIQGKLDHDFEDLGQVALKNLARTVQVYRIGGAAAAAEHRPGLPASVKPSIAVLPFDDLGSGSEQQYLGDGIVEDIITELSRSRDLLVIARNSSFQYRGKAIDVKRVGRELGAEYVVEGSVRKSGNRIRVTAQLILRHLRSAGIDFTLIEPSPLLLILEQIVGGRDVLKPLFGYLVPLDADRDETCAPAS